MTEPNDSTASTRPISVAELLAKNGTIGSPPVGGRRRRRRGNADAVTVAELTGEMPILRVDVPAVQPAGVEAADAPAAPEAVETTVDEAGAETVEETPEAEPQPEPERAPDAADADYQAHLQQRDVEPAPLPFTPRRRTHGIARRAAGPPTGVAEEMSPDPLLERDDAETRVEAVADEPSYLRSSADTLFGGDSVADDIARRPRATPGPEDIDLDATVLDAERGFAAELVVAEGAESSPFMRGVWIVLQSMLAVALGAGLFVAFDQLWRWNNIVALVLSVLVILGLVVGVRVVRRTEDLGSTLIAVAVGAMVTLGPLALLQST
jgi:hypothetical protein